jgi:hypothetical protein
VHAPHKIFGLFVSVGKGNRQEVHNPTALRSLPNVQFGSSWVQFGPNCRLGTPDNHHLSVSFGEKFLQLGDFRIADIDGNHMSIAFVSTGKTAEIFRSDSTQHPGPRADFSANSRPKCPLHVYELAAAAAPAAAPVDLRDAALPCGNGLFANEGLTNEEGTARLIMQGDGNLVLYNKNGKALWNSGTSGSVNDRLEVQSDGNLVV